MNSYDVAHRWANKDFGRRGTLKASSCSCEGRNYYSYSTVFGQWADMEKNVVIIYDGSTSITSSKHKLHKSMFPEDVHLFPYSQRYGYGWGNCELIGYLRRDEDFTTEHRFTLMEHYVDRLYDQFEYITTTKSKGAENIDFKPWDYIKELCGLYKDVTIPKLLKYLSKCQDGKRKKTMVKLLNAGEFDVEKITDAMFGEGSYKKYWDYCARYRKAEDKKLQTIGLFHRLGMSSPYGYEYSGGNYVSRDYTPNDVRKMTAKERNDLHFENLAIIENRKGDKERSEKFKKNRENAYRWIMGCEPPYKTTWNGTKAYDDSVYECHNMFTGEKYVIDKEHISRFYWADTKIDFDYNEFRQSENKEQWIREFYTKVKEVQDTRFAIEILKRVKANTKVKENRWDEDVYINDSYLRTMTNDEEYELVSWFIGRQDAYFHEKELRERAARIRREREEAERRAEEEYRERVKQEQIDECVARGIEGCRDLWRKHLDEVYNAARRVAGNNDDFFYGGNVLLRLSFHKTHVETSKHVSIAIPVCKKMWPIVKAWHENPSSFKSIKIDTKGGGVYTISSYKNDILTAGCHSIAFTEMERMYNEIQGL